MTIDPRLKRIVAAQPYPLLFATISHRRSGAMAGQGGGQGRGQKSEGQRGNSRETPAIAMTMDSHLHRPALVRSLRGR